MILFALKCAAGHEFEAWFRDNAAYDRQQRRNLIYCPECGSDQVEKALMAPRLGRSHDRALAVPAAESGGGEPAESREADLPNKEPPSPAQVRHALQVLRRHIERTCDDVGKGFAEEARRIHNGEAEARGIYGEATPSEQKALLEDGIEVASIPWVPSSDA